MGAAETIAAVNAALALITALSPQIAALTKSGAISVEDQAALAAKLEALRSHEAFSGPEWQKD